MPSGEDSLKELAWKIASALLETNHFLTVGSKQKDIFRFEDGIYKPDGRAYIERKIEENVEKDEISVHLVNEVLGHIERSTVQPSLSIFEETNPHLVLQDCLFNLETMEPEPLTPDYYALAKMKVKYDPSRDYHDSHFWIFLNEILSPEDVQGVQEELGAILCKKYLTKKMSIWEGDTDTGKTTLINVFVSLLGQDNVSSVPLQKLSERDRFSIGRLLGKMANIVDDMPREIIHSVGKLKELTGGGQIQGEQKFKDPFDFLNHAFLISSCNKLPPIEEDDDALWNRVILRAFRKRFGGHEKPDRQLIDKLTTPEELCAILNWGLEGLARLHANGWNFTNTTSLDEVREEYKKRSDPVWAFATYRLDTNDSEGFEPKEDLYNAFKAYCQNENLPNPGKDYFYKHLGDNVTVTSGRRGEKGNQKHCFIGIKLKASLNDKSHDYLSYSDIGSSGSQASLRLRGACQVCRREGGDIRFIEGKELYLHPECESKFGGKL
jgi:putative DNA primase/helicase